MSTPRDPLDALALRIRDGLPHRAEHDDPEAQAHLPHPRGSAEDQAWRAQRGVELLVLYRAYCDAQGIAWFPPP